jgi:hypothetical protein
VLLLLYSLPLPPLSLGTKKLEKKNNSSRLAASTKVEK